MTTKPLPDRLLDAREWIGFSRAEVTAALGWPPELIADFEDGTKEPSDDELALLGGLYRRPAPWFRGETTFVPDRGLLLLTENLRPPLGDLMLEAAEFLHSFDGPALKPLREAGESW